MTMKNTSSVLQKLRALMRTCPGTNNAIHAYIIPSGDPHVSEYIAKCDERRAFISGFTGSAGTAIVTENKAAMWTDGRYFIQAQAQMDSNWTLIKDGLPDSVTQGDWLCKELPPGGQVGVDPMLMPAAAWKSLSKQLDNNGFSLVPVDVNLIDQLWEDRPQRPANPVVVQALKYTGQCWQDKVTAVRQKMREKNCSMVLVTALDETAWLLNLRGSDIDYNPVFFSYSLVTMDTVYVFMDPSQQTSEVKVHLEVDNPAAKIPVQLLPYASIREKLKELVEKESKIMICEKVTNHALIDLIPKRKRKLGITPIAEMKAVKNQVEIQGMINAHVRDAVALCEYLCWLEKEVPLGSVNEISGSDQLEKFRRQQEDFMGLSFDTISAVGSNGSIIHYTSSPETNRAITADELYLIDSGAHYRDGTTDVTRTIHFGTPTDYEKECFTCVLKGHIQLNRTIFPKGVKGSRIDSLARWALWNVGLDYLHGTGHGVGSYLNVHEGYCNIGYRTFPSEVALEEGMVMSNEPGYYEDGKFGIRIESLVIIRKADPKYEFKNKDFLTFEVITPVPIQAKMIDLSLLTKEEIAWLNGFHERCREVTGEALKAQGKMDTYNWLLKETQPVS